MQLPLGWADLDSHVIACLPVRLPSCLPASAQGLGMGT